MKLHVLKLILVLFEPKILNVILYGMSVLIDNKLFEFSINQLLYLIRDFFRLKTTTLAIEELHGLCTKMVNFQLRGIVDSVI